MSGPGRAGAQSGLGPMWAHMGLPGQVLEKASTFRQLSVATRKRAFVKNVTFRIQTAPFNRIRIDLWRSPEASTHLRPSGSQKTKA